MRRALLALLLTAAALSAAAKPYRVLVVVDKWSDPAGVLVDAAKDRFQPVVALLKAWTVPFDILRLDQQVPGASYLFERDGKPRYGSIVWLAEAPAGASKNLPVVKEAVEAGSSLLVAGVRSLDPNLAPILGLESERQLHRRRSDAFRSAPFHHPRADRREDSPDAHRVRRREPVGVAARRRRPRFAVRPPARHRAATRGPRPRQSGSPRPKQPGCAMFRPGAASSFDPWCGAWDTWSRPPSITRTASSWSSTTGAPPTRASSPTGAIPRSARRPSPSKSSRP